MTTDPTSNKQNYASSMWGGRFTTGQTEVMAHISASIDVDKRLYSQDIRASKAHCTMLMVQGIISYTDGTIILQGLDQVLQEITEGHFEFSIALEDIHMNVEARLTELIGPVAGHLHTARSRNDQVATDFRLWVRDAIDGINQVQIRLQTVLLDQAEQHAATVMPGLTHMQAAQPITFGHHLLAYVEMIGRDRSRFTDTRRRLNECPLGAAALAGTSFPIDRYRTAEDLGFDRPCANSLDAVSDRDFAIEFLSVVAMCAVHLSRLAEELVLWTSLPFCFISLSDAFTSGSSIMPQKRNPDAAELVRAKVGRVTGALYALLVVMKGLPLAYAKDMQEDKVLVFEATDTLNLCLAAMVGMISDLRVNTTAMRTACAVGNLTATDLADWLVQVGRMPFRQAHYATGRLVKMAEERGCTLDALPLTDMQTVVPSITSDVYRVLDIDDSVASKTSFGGTAPKNVLSAIASARHSFLTSSN